jgi:hypothetical protein
MWVTTGDPSGNDPVAATAGVAIVRSQMRQLDDACAQCGRDPSDIARMVLTGVQLEPGLGSAEELRDAVGRYEEVGVTDYGVHWPRPGPPYEGDEARFEELFSGL